MDIPARKKLLFIGDSITDCDREKPVGEGLFGALGNGYVSIVDAFLQASYPELGIRVVNKGLSGNTVRDLSERWEIDVMEQQPDWLVIMIGINDVWRQFDSPFITEKHVYLDEYERTLNRLIEETKSKGTKIVLMTPFFIETNSNDAMRAAMDRYGKAVVRLALAHQLTYVDSQAAFNAVLEHTHPTFLAWDRIHPGATGHTVLAKAFLNSIGFDWNK
ncbi:MULTISPECIES: SGNH/GDSL hydrolase family protein [Gracilibacillus]|uniref:SGNH/GDSL hydrolase family protein n=1 Tax=Gracilibacillus TaxID=74385 RepID=UPI0008251584|nr:MULTISPECIES: SGNH/GDSL hydrolase family protein [Gracilibacillus]